MKLLDNETVINKWNYGKIKFGGEVTECSLIVTNKRVVEEQTSPISMKRTSIPLDQITGVSTMHQTTSKALGIAFMAVGGVLAVLGLILTIIVSVAFMGLLFPGLVVLGIGIYRYMKMPLKFNVIIYTNAVSAPIATGMNIGLIGSKRVIKISAHINTAITMAEMIGNVIIEAKENSLIEETTPAPVEPF